MPGRKKSLLVAMGTVVLLGWGAPGKLWASCGDYVHPQGRHDSRSAPPQSSTSEEQAPAQPAKPCPGPNCTSHNDLPPASPAPAAVGSAAAGRVVRDEELWGD